MENTYHRYRTRSVHQEEQPKIKKHCLSSPILHSIIYDTRVFDTIVPVPPQYIFAFVLALCRTSRLRWNNFVNCVLMCHLLIINAPASMAHSIIVANLILKSFSIRRLRARTCYVLIDRGSMIHFAFYK